MKKGVNSYASAQLLIQLIIGIYFFMSGLLGIIGYNSGANQLFNDINKSMGRNPYLPLIISIIFLITGLLLFIAILFKVKSQVLYLVIFVLWIVYLVYSFFTDNFAQPDLLVWLKDLSKELIILAGLWSTTVGRK